MLYSVLGRFEFRNGVLRGTDRRITGLNRGDYACNTVQQAQKLSNATPVLARFLFRFGAF
jgi:hypothetical protein